MEILYVLIPLSIVLLSIAIWFLSWAIKSGQFDDLEGPAHRILFEDDEGMIPKKTPTTANSKEHSNTND